MASQLSGEDHRQMSDFCFVMFYLHRHLHKEINLPNEKITANVQT